MVETATAVSATTLVLASASSARRTLLDQAGVFLRVEAARIDEEEIKVSLRAEGATAMQAAETLAELKARRVARAHPGALVIGADQMLDCEGRWFDKPKDKDEAASHLRALSGKRHGLMTAVCVLRDGQRVWHHNDTAYLTMRVLSEAFIADYLDAAGAEVLGAVGAYRLEGLGAQLFARVEGDYFTILGLPLLPLLDFLRNHGVLPQ